MMATPFALALFSTLSLATIPVREPSTLEEAKRAYFEGRFEASIRTLEPLLQSLSDPGELRDAAFFLGLNQHALGNPDRARSHFDSAIRHDPSFEPSEDLFNPDVVGLYRGRRSSMVGRISIESTPEGAEVSIGGRNAGTTPYQEDAVAGEHLVRVDLSGHATEERRVSVRPGETASLSVTLRALTTTASARPETGPSSGSGGGGMSGKTIGIVAGVGGGAAAALALAGGGESSGPSRSGTTTTAPAVPQNAVYSVSITPSTISAQRSTNPDFDWLVRLTVNVVESNGLGGRVDFVNVILRDAGTGSQTSPVNFGASDINSLAGTNRVEARSQLQIPLGVVYNFPSGRAAGTLTIDAQVTDDRGNRQRLSANAVIR